MAERVNPSQEHYAQDADSSDKENNNNHYTADEEKQRIHDIAGRKGSSVAEAAVLYGDIEDAEKYGYVTRA